MPTEPLLVSVVEIVTVKVVGRPVRTGIPGTEVGENIPFCSQESKETPQRPIGRPRADFLE